MIDLAAVGAGDAVGFESLANAPGVIREILDACERKLLAVIADEEEPVAAPGDIAVNAADARNVQRDGGGAAIAGYVADGHAAVGVEARFHGSAIGVDAAHARADPAEVGERDHRVRWFRGRTC